MLPRKWEEEGEREARERRFGGEISGPRAFRVRDGGDWLVVPGGAGRGRLAEADGLTACSRRACDRCTRGSASGTGWASLGPQTSCGVSRQTRGSEGNPGPCKSPVLAAQALSGNGGMSMGPGPQPLPGEPAGRLLELLLPPLLRHQSEPPRPIWDRKKSVFPNSTGLLAPRGEGVLVANTRTRRRGSPQDCSGIQSRG